MIWFASEESTQNLLKVKELGYDTSVINLIQELAEIASYSVAHIYKENFSVTYEIKLMEAFIASFCKTLVAETIRGRKVFHIGTRNFSCENVGILKSVLDEIRFQFYGRYKGDTSNKFLGISQFKEFGFFDCVKNILPFIDRQGNLDIYFNKNIICGVDEISDGKLLESKTISFSGIQNETSKKEQNLIEYYNEHDWLEPPEGLDLQKTTKINGLPFSDEIVEIIK